MPRKTEKLEKALVALRITYHPEWPTAVYYGKCAERGYEWNGQNWIRKDGGFDLGHPATVRVTGRTQSEVVELSDLLCTLLREKGFHVSLGVPRPGVGNLEGWRQYIDVE